MRKRRAFADQDLIHMETTLCSTNYYLGYQMQTMPPKTNGPATNYSIDDVAKHVKIENETRTPKISFSIESILSIK